MPILDIKITYQYYYNGSGGVNINFQAANLELDPFTGGGISYGAVITLGTLDIPNNVFPTIDDAINYFKPTALTTILTALNSAATTPYIFGQWTMFIDKQPNDKIDTKQDKLPTGATASQYLGGDLTFHNLPGAMARIQNAASLAFNTGSQVSATRDAIVNYSASIANVLTLAGGAAGYASLEVATNSGFTTGLQELSRIGNANTGGLVVGLTLNDAITGTLSGYVPAGYYRRIKTTNTTGTPTYTYVCGQETLL